MLVLELLKAVFGNCDLIATATQCAREKANGKSMNVEKFRAMDLECCHLQKSVFGYYEIDVFKGERIFSIYRKVNLKNKLTKCVINILIITYNNSNMKI